MKKPSILILIALITFLGKIHAQEFDLHTEFDIGYAFAYTDYSELAKASALEVDLSPLQFGGYLNFDLHLQQWVLHFGFRSLIASDEPNEQIARVLLSYGLGYELALTESWDFSPRLIFVQEEGFFESAVNPGLNPSQGGNFNIWSFSQRSLLFEPSFRWHVNSRSNRLVPDWLIFRPGFALPIADGEFRYKAGEGTNLLDGPLWRSQVFVNLGFGWKFDD